MVRRTHISSSDAQLITTANPEVILDEDMPVRDNEEQQKLDARVIRGKFHFYERPSGCHSFLYRRYKGEKITNYRLIDGRTYDLPWGVVRALDESSYYVSHNIETQSTEGRLVTQGEQPVYSTSRGKSRFAFMPVVN
jgi:hypothetical protein